MTRKHESKPPYASIHPDEVPAYDADLLDWSEPELEAEDGIEDAVTDRQATVTALDEYLEERGNTDDVRALREALEERDAEYVRLHPEATEETPELPVTVEAGAPYLTFDARAAAIESIMKYLNQMNKVRGMHEVSDLVRRHYQSDEKAEYVFKGAGAKVRQQAFEFESSLDTLAAADSSRRSGVPEENIGRVREDLRRELIAKYGPGHYASERRKLVTKVKGARRRRAMKTA